MTDELTVFIGESLENLDELEQALLQHEADPSNIEAVHQAFRSLHSLKGNSGFFGFSSLVAVCHSGEAVLDAARKSALPLEGDPTTVLLELVDVIRALVDGIAQTGKEPQVRSDSVTKKLDAILSASGTAVGH